MGHDIRGKVALIKFIDNTQEKFEILMQYAPCCNLPVKITKPSQTGKEWAKLVAALLPPGGSAGSRNRKEFPVGAVSGS